MASITLRVLPKLGVQTWANILQHPVVIASSSEVAMWGDEMGSSCANICKNVYRISLSVPCNFGAVCICGCMAKGRELSRLISPHLEIHTVEEVYDSCMPPSKQMRFSYWLVISKHVWAAAG